MKAPEILTPRLRLRAWCYADLPAMAAMNADPDVMAHFPAPLPRADSDALAARLGAALQTQGYGCRVIALPGMADFIGFAGLSAVRFEAGFTPAVEISWRLARPYWGRGYAAEAARACLQEGFGRLGLSCIHAFTRPDNQRSRQLMTRLGMQYQGEFEHPGLPQGHPLRPHVLYRLSHPGLNPGQRRG